MTDMVWYSVFVPMVLSSLVAAFVIPRILVISIKRRLYDVPDDRVGHKRLIPRLGGLSFFPVLLISMFMTVTISFLIGSPIVTESGETLFVRYMLLTIGMMVLYLVGAMDDLVSLEYKTKFRMQVVAALLFPLGGVWIHDLHGLFGLNEIPVWLGWLITVIVVVYITSAINIMDGIDGLASGMSMISFFVMGCLSAFVGQLILAALAFGTFGVLIPFWFWNVLGRSNRCRKIFMGDTGTLTLGYLLSFMVIYLSMEGGKSFPKGTMMVCFSTLIIPLLDVARVVVTRLMNGHNPFRPDNNYIHDRLLKTGLRPDGVLVMLLLLSAMFVGANILGVYLDINLNLLFLIDCIAWLVMQFIIMHVKSRKQYLGKRYEKIFPREDGEETDELSED